MALDLVDEVLNEIDVKAQPGAMEAQLRTELSNWETSHKELERRVVLHLDRLQLRGGEQHERDDEDEDERGERADSHRASAGERARAAEVQRAAAAGDFVLG